MTSIGFVIGVSLLCKEIEEKKLKSNNNYLRIMKHYL